MADKLIQAARYGNTYRVWELLYYGEDPDIINNRGETALIKASENGYIDIIKLLLNRNANPNIRNIYGATALMMASINSGNSSPTAFAALGRRLVEVIPGNVLISKW